MIIEAQAQAGVTGNRAANHEDYVFGDRKKRLVPPQQISGTSRHAFVAIGRDYARVSRNPMTSFNLGFEERLQSEVSARIMDLFVAYVTYGLDPADIIWLGGRHQKGSAKAVSTDMHAGFVNLILRNGVRWNPYVEKKDRPGLAAFTELVNYAFGLTSAKDPSKRKLAVVLPTPREPEWLKSWRLDFEKAVDSRVKTRRFDRREEFEGFVRSLDGVSSARIDGRVIRAVVRGKSAVIKGALATDWFYTEPDRYNRKSKAEYEVDFKRALKARLEYHQSLYMSRARKPLLPWVDLVPVDLPGALHQPTPKVPRLHADMLLKKELGLRQLSLSGKIEAITAILFGSDLGRKFDIKNAAEKRGFNLSDLLQIDGMKLTLKPEVEASPDDEILKGRLKELREQLEAWNECQRDRAIERKVDSSMMRAITGH